MAQMFPDRIPEQYVSEPGRAAGRRMFRVLQESLGREYSVFGWADFVLAHPGHGFLALEVKGGRISVDGGRGALTSLDRHRVTHPIHDPFDQARRAKYVGASRARSHLGVIDRPEVLARFGFRK